MYANHRHYILLIFAVAAFAASVFGFVYLRGEVISQATRSATILKTIVVMEDKKQHETDVASLYSKSEEDRKNLTSYVVSKDEIVSFIELVEKIGADTSTGLELSGLTENGAGEAVGNTTFDHFKAHLEASGSWANIMRALMLVENMPYNVSLNNIRLSDGGEANVGEVEVRQVGTSTPVAPKPAAKAKVWRLSMDIQVLTATPAN